MKKYVLYKDYYTGKGVGLKDYDYQIIDGKDDFEVICKAEEEWKKEENTLYLMRIMEKVGKKEVDPNGWKMQRFVAVLCKRRFTGWHRNDAQHSENPHYVGWYSNNKDGGVLEFFERIL